ncbi:hypothetical protein [Actinokineospora iranica]|uniref:Peptidase inhibitor family I36 n=1 Tax=Actinokineospora iranica TaxID=1271860 RepID=A0A1G6XQW5_9PSEU|nr:hypothetical protein [Actinokineospora iranica]SDD80594.1 hypothetical protein SAMN05216174_11882 [Actinokineospora iranica]
MNLRKTAGVLVLSAAALTATVATASPSWAAEAAPQACGLGANVPNSNLDGTGSRSGCANNVTLTVRVYKEVSLAWDELVGQTSRTNFGNGSLTADGGCAGRGSYYTYVLSSTGNDYSSGRVTRC